MSALVPIPQDCVTQGNVTPAMRQWMLSALTDAIGFDNAIIALQSSRAPRNVLLNGDFAVWQRGTSFASVVGPVNTADRWQIARSGFAAGATASRQPGAPGFQYAMRVQRNVANASTANIFLALNMESVDSIPFASVPLTLSFYARAGANFSGSSLVAQIITGNGTDQNVINGLTGQANAGTLTTPLTTSWQRFTLTATPANTETQLAVLIQFSPTGTAGAADYFEISGVQLEAGSEATAFDYRPFGEQLARCMRYFQKSFPYATTPATGATGLGATFYSTYRSGVNSVTIFERFRVPLRATPTMTFFGPVTATTNWRNTSIAADSGAANLVQAAETGFAVANPQVAADAVGNIFTLNWSADAEL